MLAEADANVIEVEHVRTNATLGLDEVEIAVQVETKGPEHCDEVVAALRARGYPLVLG
jgi:threonine dehydratase